MRPQTFFFPFAPAQDCTNEETGEDEDKVFNVIDAFDVPRLSFSSERKKYLPDSVLGRAEPDIYAGKSIFPPLSLRVQVERGGREGEEEAVVAWISIRFFAAERTEEEAEGEEESGGSQKTSPDQCTGLLVCHVVPIRPI